MGSDLSEFLDSRRNFLVEQTYLEYSRFPISVAFSKASSGEHRRMYTIWVGRSPVGSILFYELGTGIFEVYVGISRFHRGKGVGTFALRAACREVAQEANLILAYVRKDNWRSIKMCLSAGFQHIPDSSPGLLKFVYSD